MKRFALVLAAALVGFAIVVPASAADLKLPPAKIAAKAFPEKPDYPNMVKTLDPKNMWAPVYQGLWEDTIDVAGAKRPFKVYIPKGAVQGKNNIVVAVPSGVDAVAFAEASGWIAIADKYDQFLFILEGAGGKWDADAEKDVAFMTAAFKRVIDVRPYYNNNQFNFRWIGYGEGGRALEQYVMSNPKLCAALIVVDGGAVPEAYMAKMASTPAAHDKRLVNADIKTQVWLIDRKMTPELQKTVDYWVKADKCDPVAYTDAKTKTTVYLQSADSLSRDEEESIVAGRVQVSIQKADYLDKAANEKFYIDYMVKNSRYGLGCLQDTIVPTFDFAAKGVKKVEIDVDGYVRNWWEYAPASAKASKEPVPLVVVNHGAGQSGEIMAAHHSEWYKVAEARGFVVVYTSALPSTTANGVPRPSWNALGDPSRLDDVKYFNELVKKVKSTYNIDPTRVYMTGQSLGCMVSHLVAMQSPQTFAAIGATSGPIMGVDQPTFKWPANINMNDADEVPFWLIIGENDIWPGSFAKSPVMKATAAYWIGRLTGGDVDKPFAYRSGRFQHQLWFNGSGVPMFRYSITMGRGHNNIADESWMIYDEHLAKYRRVNGKIEYMADPGVVK